jgi:aryl-alcohol dehydrogenase-like predicted oxidoreductase
MYSGGRSEEIVGDFLKESGERDRIVLSTKYTLNGKPGDPNASGNGRKAMMRGVEASLKRLKTDHIDLYHLHAWDQVTPVEEVMRGLDDLVRQGKVRYLAFSDVPAWYVARAQTLAEWRGFQPLSALQMSYSLVERGLELEFTSLCKELGTGLLVWSPLANGILSGKYKTGVPLAEQKVDARLVVSHAGSGFDPLNDHVWKVIAELESVAKEIGKPMAQVAINWVANRPAVGSVILGGRKPEQISETMTSLDFEIPTELKARLDAVSTPPRVFPYWFMDVVHGWMNAGVTAKWPGYYGDR